MNFNKSKFYIYPFIIIIIVSIFTFLRINGSSVEILWRDISSNNSKDIDSLFGSPRAVRSDQFLVALPMFVSQDINNEPTINKDMGEGTNVVTQNMPSRNIFAFFKPTLLVSFFTNDPELSFSFFWYAELGLLLISTYLLLLELTKKNLLISVGGSLIFLMTPFIHWWNQTNIITWISFGLFFLLKILFEKRWKISLLYSLALSYSVVTFGLLLYPPFQLPVIYIAMSIVTGFIINQWKNIKKNIKLSTTMLAIAGIIAIGFILLFINQYKEIIELISNTIYPGARFVKAGQGEASLLLNGFYNIFLQRDSNIAPFFNQSESSNFFLLFPVLIIWVVYKNILQIKQKKGVDWLSICLSLCLLFFTLIYFIPLPDLISKYSLMYMIPHQRLLIGFGFGSYILMLYMISRQDIYKLNNNFDIIFISLLSIVFSVYIFFTGITMYKMSPEFFLSPKYIPLELKITVPALFVAVILYLFFRNYKKLFFSCFLIFAISSIIYINPVRKGLDPLINTDLARYIQEKSSEDDSKWVIYGDYRFAQYALANNANILNGVHIYPQFKIWEILDPEKKYINIYNRYAHIEIQEDSEFEESVVLKQNDWILLTISPCDEKFRMLDVKYLLTTEEIKDKSCLGEEKWFDNIKIYNLK